MKPFTMGLIIGRSFREDPGRVLRAIGGRGTGPEIAMDKPHIPDIESLLPGSEPFRSLARAVIEGNVDGARKLTARAISEGTDPIDVSILGLLKGMDVISLQYNSRQAFVPEVLLAARALNAGLGESGSTAEAVGRKGIVIIHTADGDLHDIGKNIVVALVEANGYRVIDLGTSVATDQVIAAVKSHRPLALLGSSLMTSTRNSFLATADELKKEGLDIPFIVGGGACDSAFAGQRDNITYVRDPRGLVKALDSLADRKK